MDSFAHGDSNFKYKLVLVGDTRVGKSSIVKRFTNDTFDLKTPRTIGVDFFNKDLAINNDIIKIELWDTTGQDKSKPIMEKSITDSHGIIAVYDITNKESFIHLNSWLKFIQKFNVDKNILILGNKLDKEKHRTILTHTAKLMAIEQQAKFYEVSALTGKDIEHAIKDLVLEIHSKHLQNRSQIQHIEPRSKRKLLSIDSIICTDVGETTEVETDFEDFSDQTKMGKNLLLSSSIKSNKATGYRSTLMRLRSDQMERDSKQVSKHFTFDSQFEDLESNTSQPDLTNHTLTNETVLKRPEKKNETTNLNPKNRSPRPVRARIEQRNNVGVGDYIIGGTVAASVLYVMFHR